MVVVPTGHDICLHAVIHHAFDRWPVHPRIRLLKAINDRTGLRHDIAFLIVQHPCVDPVDPRIKITDISHADSVILIPGGRRLHRRKAAAAGTDRRHVVHNGSALKRDLLEDREHLPVLSLISVKSGIVCKKNNRIRLITVLAEIAV